MTQREDRRSRERLNMKQILYRKLEQHDLNIAAVNVQRDRLVDTYQHNRAAIAAGQFHDRQSFAVETIVPNIRHYPIHLSRRGSFYTTDFKANTHLPQRKDIANAIILNPGDLHAAAQWQMLPQLEQPRTPHNDKTNRAAYDVLNEVEFFTSLRTLYTKKQLYGNQLWKVIDTAWLSSEQRQQLLTTATQSVHTKALDQGSIDAYLTSASVLAERLAFSLLARLGSQLEPHFTVFKPRAGVDRYKKVDLLARTEPTKAEPWLVGLDITMNHRPETIWQKHLDLMSQPPGLTTADPRTGQGLPLYRDIAVWPTLARPDDCYVRWQQSRGTTTITPEYYMNRAERQEFGENMLGRFCRPSGERLYTNATIDRVYQAVYGQFDDRAPAPRTSS